MTDHASEPPFRAGDHVRVRQRYAAHVGPMADRDMFVMSCKPANSQSGWLVTVSRSDGLVFDRYDSDYFERASDPSPSPLTRDAGKVLAIPRDAIRPGEPPANAPEKTYLGDGVYVETGGYHLILTVPAGSHASGRDQRIALEPDVLRALLEYRDLLARQRAAARTCQFPDTSGEETHDADG